MSACIGFSFALPCIGEKVNRTVFAKKRIDEKKRTVQIMNYVEILIHDICTKKLRKN